jgi:hypothetical protein
VPAQRLRTESSIAGRTQGRLTKFPQEEYRMEEKRTR